MAARQRGFLHAKPDGWTASRGEVLRGLGKPDGMPETDGGEYLLALLFEVGPSEYHATGGEVALSWGTLHAYGQATRSISDPWEYRALRAMSAGYVQAKRDGVDVFAIPPVDQVTE